MGSFRTLGPAIVGAVFSRTRYKAKGAVLRVQADRSDLSRLAGGAAVSYAGHIPMVQCGFGVSPWRPDDDAYEA